MESKKSNSKRIIKISIVLYIVIISLVTIYAFSWFMTNQRVEVGVNEEIKISVDNKLEISYADAEEEIWGNKIELNLEKDEVLPDITGDGLKFYYPTYLTEGDTPNMSDVGSYRELTASNSSQYLLTLKIKFRAAEKIDVYLGNTSAISPKNSSYQGENVRKSMFGDFSADYIAGCARVAFVEVENGAETLKSVWIPNDKHHLSYQEGTDNASFNANGEREENYGYHTVEGGIVKEVKYSTNDFSSGFVAVGDNNLASAATQSVGPMVNGATPLLSFSGDSIEEKELIIRIWFEGTDREADKAFNGGQVKYNFEFLGIDKDEAATLDMQKIESLTCGQDGYLHFGEDTEVATGFLYSLNGIDWQQYGGVGGIRFSAEDNGSKIYVKTIETSSNKSSAVREISIEIPSD